MNYRSVDEIDNEDDQRLFMLMKYEQKYQEVKAKASGMYEEDKSFSTFEDSKFIENQAKLKTLG